MKRRSAIEITSCRYRVDLHNLIVQHKELPQLRNHGEQLALALARLAASLHTGWQRVPCAYHGILKRGDVLLGRWRSLLPLVHLGVHQREGDLQQRCGFRVQVQGLCLHQQEGCRLER